ncbi:MAG: thiamine diphosphokinase [Candidatus Cloacimonetes bacterium]|jgi:thiamine pyrophosphokinase|nr:thiamine diphosphokinase [Candidatus Cloacimonadota bacterium]
MVYIVSYVTKEDIFFLNNLSVEDENIVVGVDQGANVLLCYNIVPDYIIGDFDSFIGLIKDVPDTVKIIKLDKKKDYSDLEYAIDYFIDKHKDICIVNNMQGRLDHILACLTLIEKSTSKTKIFICNHFEEIRLLSETNVLNFKKNTLVSLIPLSEKVLNVSTNGLEYPLTSETLFRNSSRGLSNIVKNETIEISFKTGKLLLISQSNRRDND